ncbi:MAG: DUF58 domain-containing protein [Acidobacteriia bacterium]|nr:DUF58 domain-containing protein [Terriglobia bacterium]
MTQDQPILTPAPAVRARPLGRAGFAFGPRFFVGLLLGLLWLVPAWLSPRWIAAMFVWDALLLAAWAWDLRRLPRPRQLELRRIWKKRLALATPGEIAIELRNFGPTAVLALATDEIPAQIRGTPPEVELRAAPARAAESSYDILPAERGNLRLGRIFLRYRSALGIAERWAVAETSQTVRVAPNLEEAKQHTLYLIRSRQVEMEKRRKRLRGIGREFESLREYRQGDELRDISWTATARRSALITRFFQIERSQAVWLVLDAGRLLRARVEEPGRELRLAKLDYAVNAALALAQVALHCGDRVGVLAYGRRIQQSVNAGRGPQHIRAIVESLAQVRGEPGEADHGRAARTLLTAQKRRSLVVWITDFAETVATPEVIEYAMQMTSRHLVLFAAMGQPDVSALAAKMPESEEEMFRHVAALEVSQRRDLLLRSLRQRGVLTLEMMPGKLASSLVNQYLDIKDRSLL